MLGEMFKDLKAQLLSILFRVNVKKLLQKSY